MKPDLPTVPLAPPPPGHSTNLVGVPSGLLASPAFNEHPLRLHISGVRETSPALFRMLEDSTCAEEAMDAFQKYMAAVFGVNEGPERRPRDDGAPRPGPGPRLFRSSYRRLLQGWGFDANNPEGAVLKGWVESRFGLLPTFHKEPLGRYPSRAWMTYVEEKMCARFHNNSIYTQLDMLYEFCQWGLARYAAPERSHVRLYRGINSFDEHQVIDRIDRKNVVMRLNNLASFSSERSVADCFGDTILTADVPVVKILFFNTLLPIHPLKGEGEYLVIGGDYRVTATYF